MNARVSDISLTGCYLDMLNVFASGTKVEIWIRHANLLFEGTGTVVYSMARMGMGISFDPMPPEMLTILQGWINQVRGEMKPLEESADLNRVIQNYPRVERHVLGRLIALMMRKNILSPNEGTDLLEELLREN